MSQLFSLEAVYVLTGLLLLCFAALTLNDRSHTRRVGSALFWAVLGVIFALGGVMPHWVTGLLVLLLVVLDGAGQVGKSVSDAELKQMQPRRNEEHEGRKEELEGVPGVPSSSSFLRGENLLLDNAETGLEAAPAQNIGARIFWPVLAIPLVTVAVAVAFRLLKLDANRGALVGLGFGGVAAMGLAMCLTKSRPRALLDAGRRLNEAMGAVNILPQLLGSLGVIFAAAKVGDLIAAGIQHVIPDGNVFLLVLANCLGMALFTIVMGNSFAAFPVIAAGVLVPLIVKPLGVNPALAAIITLTAGSSGTLLTPMAANFNIVPAALLNLKDQYGVLRFQWPYALTLWSLHVLLLWLFIRLA